MINPDKNSVQRMAQVLLRSLGLLLVLSACALLSPDPTEAPVVMVPSPPAAEPTETLIPTTIPDLPAATAQPQGGAAAPFLDCTPPLPRTVANPEGPFYLPNAPERTSLAAPGIPGTPLVVTGRVLAPDCAPISGALLDFWQTDAQGNYDNQGFQLRGRQFTDETGQYRLETILPGEYPGRPPHIHVKVNPPGGAVLTTQIYFAMPSANGLDDLAHPSLVTDVRFGPDGSLEAEFNFVLHP